MPRDRHRRCRAIERVSMESNLERRLRAIELVTQSLCVEHLRSDCPMIVRAYARSRTLRSLDWSTAAGAYDVKFIIFAPSSDSVINGSYYLVKSFAWTFFIILRLSEYSADWTIVAKSSDPITRRFDYWLHKISYKRLIRKIAHGFQDLYLRSIKC